ncbi:hypothetical protein AC249_AIPGENE2528, partial [Exaiptasia diaphana]
MLGSQRRINRATIHRFVTSFWSSEEFRRVSEEFRRVSEDLSVSSRVAEEEGEEEEEEAGRKQKSTSCKRRRRRRRSKKKQEENKKMKKRTIDNYALQFGKKAIPKHLFEVPSELYVKAYNRCLYMSEGRRVQHYYQEGEPCHRCSLCRKENREYSCAVCNQRMRNQPRFMERASVTRKGNGLLSANYYEEGEVYCTSCAQKMCQTHPHYPVITDPKLIHQVCKLNQMDFPPYWAVGRMEGTVEERAKVIHILHEFQDLQRDLKELQDALRKFDSIFEEEEKREKFKKWRLVKVIGVVCAFSEVCMEGYENHFKRLEGMVEERAKVYEILNRIYCAAGDRRKEMDQYEEEISDSQLMSGVCEEDEVYEEELTDSQLVTGCQGLECHTPWDSDIFDACVEEEGELRYWSPPIPIPRRPSTPQPVSPEYRQEQSMMS